MADVRKTLDHFEPWLEQSGMPFFPGFTDHSPRHINEVLVTASSLISDEAHALLSPEDITVLVLAVLLHDSGMHLTQDGFRALVQKKLTTLVSGLGDRPWNQLWTEFLSEASRFGEDRLNNIFGDSEPFNFSQLDLTDLSEKDCLLCGEFVRRHHARLAHEIAVDRVPMTNGLGLEIIGLDIDLKDLAGLVARSHGMSIRSTFSYIENKYVRIAEYRNIKIPYLMAILRISDYVQVKSDRAIKSLLSIKELRSPISRQEWRNHFAVRDVTTRDKDPEAMFVHAAPADVKTYLRLTSLFKDIQRELDDSWATIGEVYGRMGDLCKLGINIRRLRSNLDDQHHFASTVSYIPRKASFATSGPELLKLLVGPLYDYKFEIGIRELVQNAIDACKERSDLNGDSNCNVVVEIDETADGSGWVCVTDTGVGMTLDTVTNYFLIAGASFRNSDVWKQQHTDSNGKSKVLRGGRFGVGALAAFLLGDEISVKTRHANSSETDGLEFSAKIDDPVIELKKAKAPIGTSIRVWISQPDVMKVLRPKQSMEHELFEENIKIELDTWDAVDWFAQNNPNISYHWAGFVEQWSTETNSTRKVRREASFTPKKYLVPIDTDTQWNDLPTPEPYKRIAWQHPPEENRKNGDTEYRVRSNSKIVVNGIRVETINRYLNNSLSLTNENKFEGPDFKIIRPSIAIYDPSGICPINLQRSNVAFDRMGFDDLLGRDILQRFMEKVIVEAPKELTVKSYFEYAEAIGSVHGVEFELSMAPPICATNKGVFLVTPRFFESLKIERLFFVNADAASTARLAGILSDGEALIFAKDHNWGEQARLAWFRSIYGSLTEAWRANSRGFPELQHVGELGIIKNATWNLANTKGKVAKQILKRLSTNSISKTMIFVRSNNVTSTIAEKHLLQIQSIFQKLSDVCEVSVWLLQHSAKGDSTIKSPLCEEWLRTVGAPLLEIS
ncbi:chaperone protein HtpG [Rhodoferax lithotrophicus]|uniref:Chaperone protein HtpG n=2 Tax=Rhodoferax lithotrophicus TaxID=2798804 RepID=A0ABN6D8F3_9BURK|nr:chaperone protein HtpG [Rhodoferax sp. MIZ03]